MSLTDISMCHSSDPIIKQDKGYRDKSLVGNKEQTRFTLEIKDIIVGKPDKERRVLGWFVYDLKYKFK